MIETERTRIEVAMGTVGSVKKTHDRAKIQPGAKLPETRLRSTGDRIVDIAVEARDHHLVLFFYPGDLEGLRYPEISGCTPEACMFRDNVAALKQLGALVFGISLHPTNRQKSFVEREHLTFELLSDAERQLIDPLGMPLWTTEHGETFVARTTIIVRRGGKIARVFNDVVVTGHIDAVLEEVRRLGG